MFLGHEISKDGIMVDLTKIEAMHRWAKVTSITEVRSSIPLAYSSITYDSSRDSLPLLYTLTRLTHLGILFGWSEECEKSF